MSGADHVELERDLMPDGAPSKGERVAFSAGIAHANGKLRDEFAKAALPALITGRSWPDVSANEMIATWASCAYLVADAMLAARVAK